MRYWVRAVSKFGGLAGLLAASLVQAADTAVLDQAEKLYRHTNYDGAIRLLAAQPLEDSAVAALLGQCYFMSGEYKKATDIFEKLIAQDSETSVYHLWAGRGYGRRAESAFALNAMAYAGKARGHLERAFELDPANKEAQDDLFDFYVQAPGVVGGGLDKASKLASKIGKRDAAEGMYDLARIAEARKDYEAAEADYRRAIELAPHQIGRVLDLAKFLARRGRYEESDRVFQQAENIAPNYPKVLFAQASTYIKTNRNMDRARVLLSRYLTASNLTPDDPPKSEAQRLLRKASGS